MKTLLLVGVFAAGCTKPNPALSCEDGLCSDPTVPYCDVTGSLGGDGPNTCIHVACTPNAFAECRGDKAVTCNAQGDNYDLLTCAQGCDASSGCKPEPPCETLDCKKHIIPRYVPSECDAIATNADLMVQSDITLNTTDAANCTRIVTQQTGPEICVVHHPSITVAASATITAVGSRALALVADTTLRIDGVVDANGRSGNAAGGGLVESGGTSNNTVAGGGAGYRTYGGGGASASGNGGANNGGAAITPSPATLTYLFGGPRSGAINNGGGALTLISCRGTANIPGIIDVGGGGGRGAQDLAAQQGGYQYALGGGAGGTVVVQGASLSITGQLFSNGGGGGGGDTMAPTKRVSESGAPGARSLTSANGGDVATIRHGGGGATNDNGPGVGGSDGTSRGGAGGGAAGYLLTYSPSGASVMINPTMVSPPLDPNGTISTN